MCIHKATNWYFPSKPSLQIYKGPLSARQGSWRADNGPLKIYKEY